MGVFFRKNGTWVVFIVTYICILCSVYDQSSIAHFHTLVANLPVGPAWIDGIQGAVVSVCFRGGGGEGLAPSLCPNPLIFVA